MTMINGRHVERGTEVSIRSRGRMRFLYETACDHGGCLTFYDKDHKFVTVHRDMVRTVHWKKKLR